MRTPSKAHATNFVGMRSERIPKRDGCIASLHFKAARIVAEGMRTFLNPAEAGAGFVEVFVFFGEAEAKEIFTTAGAEEGGAGYRGYAGNCE